MKKQFALIALFAAMMLPQAAQSQQIRLSLSDQQRFDSYYSRWKNYKATNNQGEVRSMEGRMQDVYRHYGIPAGTPYGRVATGGGGWRPTSSGSPRQTIDTNGARDPYRPQHRDWDRDHARYEHREWEREREREEARHDQGLHRGWSKDHDHDGDRREHHDSDRHDTDRHDHHEGKGNNSQDHKPAHDNHDRDHQR